LVNRGGNDEDDGMIFLSALVIVPAMAAIGRLTLAWATSD
jgi:hypothetical protein